jgi:hypothetical protein
LVEGNLSSEDIPNKEEDCFGMLRELLIEFSLIPEYLICSKGPSGIKSMSKIV